MKKSPASKKRNFTPDWVFWLSVLLVTLGLIGLSAWFRAGQTFFTPDTGLRFRQIENLIQANFQTFAINYPWRSLDPALNFAPYYGAHLVVEGVIYLSLTPFFLWLSAWLYVWGGWSALGVVPAVGAVVSALGVYHLVKLAELPGPKVAFWGALFATPIFFYSLPLWDHTFGLAFAIWAVYGVGRGLVRGEMRWLFVGGLLGGLATGQRAELNTFALALGGAVMLASQFNWKQIGATLAGGITGVLPVWAAQMLWFGHPFGPVTSRALLGYGRREVYPMPVIEIPLWEKKAELLTFLELATPLTLGFTLTATGLVFLGLIAMVLSLKPGLRFGSVAMRLGLGGAVVGYLLFMLVSLRRPLTGLLPTFPLIAFSLIYLRFDERSPAQQKILHRFVWWTVLLFLGIMLVFWPASGGWQWGARYLLPAYPLMLYLMVQVYASLRQKLPSARWPGFQQAVLTLALLSVLLQILGVRFLYVVYQEQRPLLQALQAAPAEVVLTDMHHLPSRLATAKQTFLYMPSLSDAQTLWPQLTQAGVSGVIIITEPDLPLMGLPGVLSTPPSQHYRFEAYPELTMWLYALPPPAESAP